MRALLVLASLSLSLSSVVATVGAGNLGHTAEQTCCDCDEEDMPHKTTMLLQMHHHLERDLVHTQHVSILETCPLDKFQSSLARMLENELFVASNITNPAQTRYLELAEQKQCEVGTDWYVSQKPLIINVGDGTTATQWLDGVMSDLGFNTWHGWPDTPVNGTFFVDDFDFLSDVPAAARTWQLLQSHPQALFLMTLRDPVGWAESRKEDHEGPVLQALPCGGYANMRDPNNPVELTYVAYSAWARCVIPENRFLATNVFTDEQNDAKFVEELIQFLETHGLQKPDWKNRTARVRASVS